jgi:hypothetical protein
MTAKPEILKLAANHELRGEAGFAALCLVQQRLSRSA